MMVKERFPMCPFLINVQDPFQNSGRSQKSSFLNCLHSNINSQPLQVTLQIFGYCFLCPYNDRQDVNPFPFVSLTFRYFKFQIRVRANLLLLFIGNSYDKRATNIFNVTYLFLFVNDYDTWFVVYNLFHLD